MHAIDRLTEGEGQGRTVDGGTGQRRRNSVAVCNSGIQGIATDRQRSGRVALHHQSSLTHSSSRVPVIDHQRIRTIGGVDHEAAALIVAPHRIKLLVTDHAISGGQAHRTEAKLISHRIQLDAITSGTRDIKAAMHDIGLAAGERKRIPGVQGGVTTNIHGSHW